MTLQEAITQQADIICSNLDERAKVIEILEAKGWKNKWKDHRGVDLIIWLFSYHVYACHVNSNYTKGSKRLIPAKDFIASNKITVSK